MRRSATLSSVVAWAISLPLLLTAGCVENNQTIFIRGNIKPDSQCEIRANAEGPFLMSGTLDLVTGGSYQLFPMVQNSMPSSLVAGGYGVGEGRLESHNVFLKEAKLTYTYDGNIAVRSVTSRTVPIYAFVTQSEGLAVVQVEAVDSSLAAAMAQRLPERDVDNPMPSGDLLVDVQMTGETSDGTEVTTNVLSYRIRVCKGCLLEFPPEADVQSEASPALDCNDLSAEPDETPCFAGQDEPVDCRLCKRSKPLSERIQCEPIEVSR